MRKVLLAPTHAIADEAIRQRSVPLDDDEVLTVVTSPHHLIGVKGTEVYVVQDREQFCARQIDRKRFLMAAGEVGRMHRTGELAMKKVWLTSHAQKERTDDRETVDVD